MTALWQRLERRFGRTSTNLWLVFNGQLLRFALGLLSSVIITRALGPVGLSAYAVTGSVIMIALSLARGGLRESAVRFLAGRSPEERQPVIQQFSLFRLVGAGLTAGVLALLATPLATLLNLPTLSGRDYLWLAALSVLVTTASDVVSTLFQAQQRFGPLVVLQSVNAGLTVPLVLALFLAGQLTVESALWVGVVTALAGTLVGWGLLDPASRRALRPQRRGALTTSPLLSFGKWLWLAELLTIVSVQIDLLLLNRLVAPAQVGLYALALSLFFKAQIVNQSQYAVLLPEASALKRGEFRGYYRHAVRRNVLFVPPILLLMPASFLLVPWVYGASFAGAAPILVILLTLVLFDLFVEPLLLLLYPLDRPRAIAGMNGARLMVTVAMTLALVPVWGLYGAALAKVAGKVVSATLGLGVLQRARQREG